MDTLTFRIGGFRPDTIPMARLAQYMAELAALLGYEKSVHFVRMDEGSVDLVHRVDVEDQPKVGARLDALCRGEADGDAIKAYRKLDEMLANDNTIGELTTDHKTIVIQFPGRDRPKPVHYGAFTQFGSLDGVPVKVGGLAELVTIHLQEVGPTGTVHHCYASRDIARAIAGHLFDTPVRVHGNGRWQREASRAWKLHRFVISEFEVLDDSPLETVVAQLRAITGSEWRTVERPLVFLRDLRGNGDGVH